MHVYESRRGQKTTPRRSKQADEGRIGHAPSQFRPATYKGQCVFSTSSLETYTHTPTLTYTYIHTHLHPHTHPHKYTPIDTPTYIYTHTLTHK